MFPSYEEAGWKGPEGADGDARVVDAGPGLRAGGILLPALATTIAAGSGGAWAAECEEAPPTPVAVSVKSVPITVTSTEADYFVLYVTHDLGDGDVRDVPVSVTPGEEGTTSLGWNLSGLPASRYRVEKYEIDDPGDVDGDCKNDMTDPNPVNPARDIELKDGLNRLSTSAEWDAIHFETVGPGSAFFGPGTEYLKLYSTRLNPPSIYFMNAMTHWAHTLFRFKLNLPLPAWALEVDRATGMDGTGSDVDTYYWWFSSGGAAVLGADEVPWLHSAIGANLPIMPAEASEWRLAYYIPDTKWEESTIETLLPLISGYESAGIPVLRDRSFASDTPNISVSVDEESVTEGQEVSVTFTADPLPGEALTVAFSVAEASGSDFLGLGGNRVGRALTLREDAGSATVTLPTVDDRVDGADGSATVSVFAGSGYLTGWPRSARFSVVDNDVGASIAVEAATVDEGTSARVLVQLSEPLASPVTVPLVATGGEVGDYTAPGSVFFPSGTRVGTTSFSTAIDPDVEDEIVTLGFGVLPAMVSPGSSTSATLTIRDQTPEATLAVAPSAVREGASATVTVSLSRAWPNAVTVPLLVTEGDAEPDDYALPSLVTIAARAVRGSVALVAVDDGDQDDETLTVSLGAPPSGIVAGAPNSVLVTIHEDEPPPSVEVGGGSEVTEGMPAVFSVTANPAPVSDLNVTIFVADDSRSDFVAESDEGRKVVTIRGGESETIWSVPTVDDEEEEANGFVSLSPRRGGDDYNLGPMHDATASVLDNDSPKETPPPPPSSQPPSPPPPPPPPPPDPDPHPVGPLKANFVVDAVCSSDPCRLLTGVRVAFSDLTGGGVIDWRWRFGDGETSRMPSPAHEYRSPGFYEVSLTVSDGVEESVARRVFLVEAAEPDGTCVGDAVTRCLRDSRFAVEVDWKGPDGPGGDAQVVHVGTNDSALFSFFNRTNWEILLKVLDGCSVNGNFWLFAASTTDLGFAIRVTDTVTGLSRAYSNEPGVAAPAVADTEAFPGACADRR